MGDARDPWWAFVSSHTQPTAVARAGALLAANDPYRRALGAWVPTAPGVTAPEGVSDVLVVARPIPGLDVLVATAEPTVSIDYRRAFTHALSPILFTDPEGRILDANESFCRLVGWDREYLIGRSSDFLTLPEDVELTPRSLDRARTGEAPTDRYVKRYRRRDGRVITVEVSRSAIYDDEGALRYTVVSERDVTEERQLNARLAYGALHDPLTGLANRALLDERLAQSRARLARERRSGAVLMIDLDEFKDVNDTHGHLVGDHLLAAVARRLESVARAGDTLARYGGDEFLYLAEGVAGDDGARRVAERVREALSRPFRVLGVSVTPGVSIGVATWGPDGGNDGVVEAADLALYEAKRRGRGTIVAFTDELRTRAVDHLSRFADVRAALARGEIKMHFQPLVTTATGTVVGFEALLRWRHPTRGVLEPRDILARLEGSEVELSLGTFTIERAVAFAGRLSTVDGVEPFVTVNLSDAQFRDPALTTRLARALEVHAVAPARLIVEVAEADILRDVAASITTMGELSTIGVGLAIDHFGAGLASLVHLLHLHPAMIKLDPAFLRQGPLEHGDVVLDSLVEFGGRYATWVLAEGVETTEELSRLRALECPFGQGFLFAPALPEDDAARVVGRPLLDPGHSASE